MADTYEKLICCAARCRIGSFITAAAIGDVGSWHKADMTQRRPDVRFRG
jgi:hypothetical protein